MIQGIADTHTIIWYVYSDNRLSARARSFIDTTLNDGNLIGMSSITMIEMTYLIEKGRIAAESFSRVARALTDVDSGLVEIPIDLATARTLSRVSAKQIPDMPDRIIAAAALQQDVPVISRDGRIAHSDMETIW